MAVQPEISQVAVSVSRLANEVCTRCKKFLPGIEVEAAVDENSPERVLICGLTIIPSEGTTIQGHYCYPPGGKDSGLFMIRSVGV